MLEGVEGWPRNLEQHSESRGRASGGQSEICRKVPAEPSAKSMSGSCPPAVGRFPVASLQLSYQSSGFVRDLPPGFDSPLCRAV